MTKITKSNALWNIIKPNPEEAVKNDKEVKHLTAELATLKRTEDNLFNTIKVICQTFSDESDVVEELHTTANSHIDTLQGQITESTSTIMTIYRSINEIPSTLKTLQDQQEAASTLYKAATGATTNRHKDLKRVREAIHSYRQVVDASEGLHANAKIKINKLQGKLKASQSATKEISDSIEGHFPSMKNLMTEHGKAKKVHAAAVLSTSNKDKELRDATETALEALADKITISEGRRAIKKALINTMDRKFEFQNWTCNDPKNNRQLWPQVEGILCILVDLPIFFSLVELETLLGYKGGNNNVKMALKRMAEEDMLILKDDKLQTEKYYLGKMARAILDRRIIPDISVARPADLAATVQEHIAAGHLHGNKNKRRKSKAVTPDQSTDTPSASTKVSPTPKKPKILDFDEPSIQEAKEGEATIELEKKGSSTENALEVTSEEDTSDSSVEEMTLASTDNGKSIKEAPQGPVEV